MSELSNRGAPKQVRDALDAMEQDDDVDLSAIIWDGLSSIQRDQLNQLLHQGPVWDGNVLSKSARSDLINYYLATQCCFMGDDGYTVATYLGKRVFRAGKAEPFRLIPGKRG